MRRSVAQGYLLPDDEVPGAVDTGRRLLGRPRTPEPLSITDFAQHLQTRLDEVRRAPDTHSYAKILRGWNPGLAANPFVAVYAAAGLSGGGGKPHVRPDASCGRTNAYFVYTMAKAEPDPPPEPYTDLELNDMDKLPRNLMAERVDAKSDTFLARVETILMGTPVDVADGHPARPLRTAMCTVWRTKRWLTPPGLDCWRVAPDEEGIERLVMLDGPGIKKVVVLDVPRDMSLQRARKLCVVRGAKLVATVHGHSRADSTATPASTL